MAKERDKAACSSCDIIPHMSGIRRFGEMIGAGSGAAARSGTLSHRDNSLLAALSSPAGALLDRPTYLSRGECLWETGSALTHLYFPVRGLVSLGYASESGENTHLALVGREGVIGVEAVLGADKAIYRALVQLAGAAYRLPLVALGEHGASAPLLRYALALMVEISRSSVCNLRHSVEQRLCRSLLQSADQAGSDILPMTQDEVASLVGARRQGVSEAAQKLRDLGLISTGRRSIAIVDRPRLTARACECYEMLKRERKALGTPVSQPHRRLAGSPGGRRAE